MSCPLKTAGPLDDFGDEAIIDSFLIRDEDEEPEEQIGLLDSLQKLWNKE